MGPPARTNKRRGFTLIEVLVVVLILGIVAALVSPLASDGGQTALLSGARLLAADLQYAQNVAITTRKPVTVTFDAPANTYTLSDPGGALAHPVEPGDYRVNLGEAVGRDDVELVSADFGGTGSVSFDEFGSPDQGGTVTVHCRMFVYEVNVTGAGRVTVSDVTP